MKTTDIAKRNHKTKKEWLAKEVARAVIAGKTWDCEDGGLCRSLPSTHLPGGGFPHPAHQPDCGYRRQPG
jgi:hypothetical protein